MSLFDSVFSDLVSFLDEAKNNADKKSFQSNPENIWPSGGNRNFILKQDTAVELGNPKTESISLLVWSSQSNSIYNGLTTSIGPSLEESKGNNLPFGQIILLGIDSSTHDNEYELFRELEDLKYQLDLQGYIRRGVSQFLREWSRVSYSALEQGFTLQTLGNELIRQYRGLDYIKTIEVAFITDLECLKRLRPLAIKVSRIIEAMNKMLNESLMDCDDCDYTDVCKDVEELRTMRKQKLKMN